MNLLLTFCLILNIFMSNVIADLPDPVPASNQLYNRLEKIKNSMAKMRFCYNDSCFYRNLTSKLIPPSQENEPYRATISASIDRPSASPDLADYHFIFHNDRWQLVAGEEYTDVADFSFVDDRYEINSVHSSRLQTGNLDQARKQGKLRAGYLVLYYEILDRGVERLP
jgi:hypothetical protein